MSPTVVCDGCCRKSGLCRSCGATNIPAAWKPPVLPEVLAAEIMQKNIHRTDDRSAYVFARLNLEKLYLQLYGSCPVMADKNTKYDPVYIQFAEMRENDLDDSLIDEREYAGYDDEREIRERRKPACGDAYLYDRYPNAFEYLEDGTLAFRRGVDIADFRVLQYTVSGARQAYKDAHLQRKDRRDAAQDDSNTYRTYEPFKHTCVVYVPTP
jgi:hypothetical protein